MSNNISVSVTELVRLIQSRKPSAPQIFYSGEPVEVNLSEAAPIIGEDAAHDLNALLGGDPFECFEKLALLKSIKADESGSRLLDSLEWIIGDSETDSPVKRKAAEVANMCIKDGIEVERSLQVLLKLLKDLDADIVSFIAEDLKSTLQSKNLSEDVFKRLVVGLLEAFESNNNDLGSIGVRASVASAFGMTKDNLEKAGLLDEGLTFLEKALKDPQDLVRAMSANALSLIPTQRSKQILVTALETLLPGDERTYVEQRLGRVSRTLDKK